MVNKLLGKLPLGKIPKLPLGKLPLGKLPFGSLAFRKASQLVGVDIGTASIKVCLVDQTKEGGLVCSKMVGKSYDEDLLHEGNIVDRIFVAQELKSLLDMNGISATVAASALSSYSVITKRVNMPFLEKEALQNSIQLEVENIIPFPLKDIYYSYYPMGMDEEKQNMMNLLIVAAKKEIVDGYAKTFELAKLDLAILDVDIFGITNLIEQIYHPKDFSVIAVDIGASVTNIAIMKDVNIEFTREILIGGRYVTNEIAGLQRITYKQAEEEKCGAGSNVSEVLEEFVVNISSEINKTINFYVATKPRETVGKVYLTGGSALIPGLKEQIEKETEIPVEFLDPFLLFQDRARSDVQGGSQFNMPVALYLSSRAYEKTA
jgi:type IV pilus assembly protein PilM